MPAPYYGRWNATAVLEKRLDSDWPTASPYATNIITPTSIVSTGTGNSSSIGANGSVTFSTCATLSLNGVFTADYDNYMVTFRSTESVSNGYRLNMRVGGTDNTTASSYVYQMLSADGSTISGARSTQTYTNITIGSSTLRTGTNLYLYGPFLAQPTAGRSTTMSPSSNAAIYDYVFTHNQSTSYDGFTITSSSGNISGVISVYGLGN